MVKSGIIGGLGHGLGNFVFHLLFNLYHESLQKHRQPMSCRVGVDIDIIGPNPSVNTCSNTSTDSTERNDASL